MIYHMGITTIDVAWVCVYKQNTLEMVLSL